MRTSFICSTLTALVAFSLGTSRAHGYFSTIDTGELIAPGQYQMTLEPQVLLNRYEGGANIVGRIDTGLNESSSIRGILGFGRVDYQIGGMYKYIPYPDVDKQPAIGGEVGVILARVSNQTEFSIRLHPLISKRFETEIGDVIPYGSIPFGTTTRSDKTVVPVQIAIGSELRPLNMQNLSAFAELGINVSEAFSYISLAAAWRFNADALKTTSKKK